MTTQFWIASGIALCILATTSQTQAQVLPDATLPNNSNVSSDGNTSIITGGTVAGTNLYHSFDVFSVPTGNTAYFNNTPDIQNIISRVTGASASNIDGLIKANGTANLFLINPRGIIFGNNARLNIGGSFIASTASGLNFADGNSFSAATPQTTPLLTVSVPTGLQFGETTGSIRVQGSGHNVSLDPDTFAFVRGENPAARLQVQAGKTLALVGGDVTLEGGNLIAEGGQISVGSVESPGFVSLTPSDKGWTLGYSGIPNGNIQLSGRASIDASSEGGGDIQVQGRRVTLEDGSAIFALTLAAEPGGTLNVNASDSLELIGTAADDLFPSAVFTDTEGAGAGGALTINTRQLLAQNGAIVTTDTVGTGKAGNLRVNASDSVQLSGTTADGLFPSVLSTTTQGDGAAGDLTINTKQLLVQNGAAVLTDTFGKGKAGNLTVNALDSVELIGTSTIGSPSGLSTITEGDGSAGDLTINTKQLLIQDGAVAIADTFGAGDAGNLTANASDFVKLSGTSADGLPSVLLAQVQPEATGSGGNLTIETGQLLLQNEAVVSNTTAGTGAGGNLILKTQRLSVEDGAQVSAATLGQGAGGTLEVKASEWVELKGTSADGHGSLLTTQTKSTGDAGNLTVETRQLNIQAGGEASVKSSGSGNAGNLEVTANSIRLENGGKLLSTSTLGNGGGDITLNNQDLLLLRGNGVISATAGEAGNGGNINIDTNVLGVVDRSNITAKADRGRGGRIQISTQGLFVSPDSQINADSEQGINGVVEIARPDIAPNAELVTLPAQIIDISRLIASGCSTGRGNLARGTGEFVITGRGGLPPNPAEATRSDTTLADLGKSVPSESDRPTTTSYNPINSNTSARPLALVEANSWATGSKGEIILLANNLTFASNIPWLKPNSCNGS